MTCNCGSNVDYDQCCEIYHANHSLVPSAEKLMRSRYCAYTLHLADYIYETTLPSERKYYSKTDILNWAVDNKWMELKIIKAIESTVEFKAHYLDKHFEPQIHHEKSIFNQLNGKWYYVNGVYP